MKMLDNCICGGLSDAQGSLEQLHRNRIFLVSATIERLGQCLVAQSWRKDAALCKAAFSDSYVVVPACQVANCFVIRGVSFFSCHVLIGAHVSIERRKMFYLTTYSTQSCWMFL